jgi:hypothetical protein
MIKRSSLRIHGIEVEAKIQTDGIENLFKKIIEENF